MTRASGTTPSATEPTGRAARRLDARRLGLDRRRRRLVPPRPQRRHAQGRRQAHRPAEVESALVGDPAVVEAAVGIPHEVKGEVVWCFCVLRPGTSQARTARAPAAALRRGAREGVRARGGALHGGAAEDPQRQDPAPRSACDAARRGSGGRLDTGGSGCHRSCSCEPVAVRRRILLLVVGLGVVAAGVALAARDERVSVTPTIGVSGQRLELDPGDLPAHARRSRGPNRRGSDAPPAGRAGCPRRALPPGPCLCWRRGREHSAPAPVAFWRQPTCAETGSRIPGRPTAGGWRFPSPRRATAAARMAPRRRWWRSSRVACGASPVCTRRP